MRLNSRLNIGEKKNVRGRDKNIHHFENFCLQYWLCGLKKNEGLYAKKNSYFLYAIAFVFRLEKWFIKGKKKKCIAFFVLCNAWIIFSGAYPFIN